MYTFTILFTLQPLSEIVIGGASSRHKMVSLDVAGVSWEGSPSHGPSSASPQNSPSFFGGRAPKPEVVEKKSFFGNLVSAVPNILPQLGQFPGAGRSKSAGDLNVSLDFVMRCRQRLTMDLNVKLRSFSS
jgi:hypothetical protein